MDINKGIKERNLKVAIIGLGYVGLPLAVALAKVGYIVIGIDYNQKKVNTINEGRSDLNDVSSEVVKELVEQKRFVATTVYEKIAEVQVIIICVPTPLNEAKEPDLTYIIKAMDGILSFISKGVILSLESTTYPGTTKELIVERVEKEKGWVVGKDFYVCYSPERVDPGNKNFFVENTPKVIGGATPICLEIGKTLYQSFLKRVVGVSSTEVAEMSKLLENTFRCVNIALVNEMTMMCERMGIDIWEVIKGASTKPFGFTTFYPGPGVGGHCIPLDPLYLSWEAKKYNYFNRFIELASDINQSMPYYVVRQAKDLLALQGKVMRGSHLLVMGMSYKKDISDLRESPSLEVYELLTKEGAKVDFYDPYISHFYMKENVIEGIQLNEENIRTVDLILILTDHSNVDYEWLAQQQIMIYDTRNVYKDSQLSHIKKLGTFL